jgi:hypothetical protein
LGPVALPELSLPPPQAARATQNAKHVKRMLFVFFFIVDRLCAVHEGW